MFSDKYTKMSEEVVSKFYDQQKYFIIPYSSKILEAQQQGLPISHYKSSSAGSVYKKLADEIMSTKEPQEEIKEDIEPTTEQTSAEHLPTGKGEIKTEGIKENSNEEIFID